MRISDWSSDVCSSDLVRFRPLAEHVDRAGPGEVAVLRGDADPQRVVTVGLQVDVERAAHVVLPAGDRKSVVSGKSVSVRVDLGGRRIIQQKSHRKPSPKNTTYNVMY